MGITTLPSLIWGICPGLILTAPHAVPESSQTLAVFLQEHTQGAGQGLATNDSSELLVQRQGQQDELACPNSCSHLPALPARARAPLTLHQQRPLPHCTPGTQTSPVKAFPPLWVLQCHQGWAIPSISTRAELLLMKELSESKSYFCSP